MVDFRFFRSSFGFWFPRIECGIMVGMKGRYYILDSSGALGRSFADRNKAVEVCNEQAKTDPSVRVVYVRTVYRRTVET